MIRQATREDIPDLLKLGAQFHAESGKFAFVDYNLESVSATIEMLLDKGVVFFREAKGMLGLFPHPEWISGETVAAELFWWVLDKGEGFGGQLLDKAEEWVKEKQLGKFNITLPYNTPIEVLLWLDRRGYRPVEVALSKIFA